MPCLCRAHAVPMPCPCRAHAVPMAFPCLFPARLIHTCHAASLPFSDIAVFFVKFPVVDGNIRPASPANTLYNNNLRGTPRCSRTRVGLPHDVSGRPMLIHTCHALTMPRSWRAVPWPWEVFFRMTWSWHGTGTAWTRNGMCETNTAALCKLNGKDNLKS
jgi:hypothetical protein